MCRCLYLWDFLCVVLLLVMHCHVFGSASCFILKSTSCSCFFPPFLFTWVWSTCPPSAFLLVVLHQTPPVSFWFPPSDSAAFPSVVLLLPGLLLLTPGSGPGSGPGFGPEWACGSGWTPTHHTSPVSLFLLNCVCSSEQFCTKLSNFIGRK